MPIIKSDKESIIRHSIHLFKKHGYYKTTMANIGKECGLIKGSIYHHFPSKEALALTCLQHIHQHFSENIFNTAYITNISEKKKLQLFVEKTEDYFLNSEGGCLLANLAMEAAADIPDFKKVIRAYFDEWQLALIAILSPKLGKTEAEQSAQLLIAQVQGSIMLMNLYDDAAAFKHMNQQLQQLL